MGTWGCPRCSPSVGDTSPLGTQEAAGKRQRRWEKLDKEEGGRNGRNKLAELVGLGRLQMTTRSLVQTSANGVGGSLTAAEVDPLAPLFKIPRALTVVVALVAIHACPRGARVGR